MKKSILFFVALVVCSLLCSIDAQNFKDVVSVTYGQGVCSLVEGDFGALKQKTSAKMVIDFSNTHIVKFGSERGNIVNDLGTVKEFFSDKDESVRAQWNVMKLTLKQNCIETFNKKFNMQVTGEESPKYEVRLVVDNICIGMDLNDSTFKFRHHQEGGAEFNGNLKVSDIKTGDLMLDLRIDDMKGADPSAYHQAPNKRVMFTFSDIFFGKYLPKLVRKNSRGSE